MPVIDFGASDYDMGATWQRDPTLDAGAAVRTGIPSYAAASQRRSQEQAERSGEQIGKCMG